jgi:hypothetical protein
MQVSQSKFIFLKVEFWGIDEIFSEGLNPFKIQKRFKVDLFLNFII